MGRCIITRYKGAVVCGLWEDGRARTLDIFPEDVCRGSAAALGDVFIGRVTKILKGTDSCFVDVRPGTSCYLPLDRGTVLRADGSRTDKVREGDELIVQISREATGHKAPVLTCKLTFPGEPDPQAVFARTADSAATRTCYTRLYTAPSPLARAVTACCLEDPEMIRTDIPEVFSLLNAYFEHASEGSAGGAAAGLAEKVSLYTDDYPLALLYGVSKEMDRALGKRVYLKSGATLVIEHTEALWTVDVNSAKSVRSASDRRENILETNLEAARETASQMVLRNMSGIIVIDFVKMSDASDREAVIRCLKEECAKDPVYVDVAGLTALGLAELTRKRTRPPLYEQAAAFLNDD